MIERVRTQSLSFQVSYQQAGTLPRLIPATIVSRGDQATADFGTGYGATIDFVVSRSDLEGVFPPQRGDRISATIGGIAATYEAIAPDAISTWEYADSTMLSVKIRTVKISEG